MAETHAGDLTAAFNYLRHPPTDDPAIQMQYDAIHGERTTMRLAPVDMPVIDGRGLEAEFSLDREGFALVRHHTTVTDFLDRQQTEIVYPDEAAALIKSLTGADHAFATGTNVRFGDKRNSDYAQTSDHKPAGFPHADFTEESAANMLALGGPAASHYPRWAIYNLWRVFSEAPQDYPLALCDARSVAPGDEDAVQIMIDVPGRDSIRSMTVVYYPNPDHRWIYFSNMATDEALVFKSFDSDADRPRRVPHTAFRNPLAGRDAPSRRSIETRVVALFNA